MCLLFSLPRKQPGYKATPCLNFAWVKVFICVQGTAWGQANVCICNVMFFGCIHTCIHPENQGRTWTLIVEHLALYLTSPKHYWRELSMTNDIRKVWRHVRMHWPRYSCLVLMHSAITGNEAWLEVNFKIWEALNAMHNEKLTFVVGVFASYSEQFSTQLLPESAYTLSLLCKRLSKTLYIKEWLEWLNMKWCFVHNA